MSTFRIPLGTGFPDTSGSVYPSTMNAEMALTNVKYIPVMVMAYPTSGDVGTAFVFRIPENYVGTPALKIYGILDGTPANVLAFGASHIAVADTETTDVAYDTDDLVNISSWTGYSDEDLIVLTISLTPASAYVVGDVIFLRVYRDDSVDTTTFNFLLLGVDFQYSDV